MDKVESKFSRRDFLKLGAAAAVAIPLTKQFENLNRSSIEIEQEKSFSTDFAVYVPFFETHTRRDSNERIIKTSPNYLFLEDFAETKFTLEVPPLSIIMAESETYVTDTELTFLKMYDAATQILNPNKPVKPQTEGRVIKTGRILDDEVLSKLAETDSGVAFEGMAIPPDLDKKSQLINLAETVFGTSVFMVSAASNLKKLFLEKEGPSASDKTKLAAYFLLLSWSVGDDAVALARANVTDTLSSLKIDPNGDEGRKIRDSVDRLANTLSLTHPENLKLFLRNIFMALKLITIGEQNVQRVKGKPTVAFRIGRAHEPVSDLIKLGKGVCLSLLNVYPNSVLKEIIEFNVPGETSTEEKIRTFSSTAVIPIKEALQNSQQKHYLVDNELNTYLRERLLKND